MPCARDDVAMAEARSLGGVAHAVDQRGIERDGR